MNINICYIIIPIFNEELNILPLIEELSHKVIRLVDNIQFKILFIDDGSTDNTLEIIKTNKFPIAIQYIQLTRNFGHQNAIRAGMSKVFLDKNIDFLIVMDGDLQHPAELLNEMIKHWRNGIDIVNTQRIETEINFKMLLSKLFYKIHNAISPIKLIPGCADFRLISKKGIEALKKYNEHDFFFRGIIQQIGLSQLIIPYRVNKRLNGSTKYSIKKMLLLAISGITSFSNTPLYMSLILAGGLALLAILYFVYVVYIKFFLLTTVTGWPSLMLSILILGSAQLFVLGIIGIYVGKIFNEVKKRPQFLINNEIEKLP